MKLQTETVQSHLAFIRAAGFPHVSLTLERLWDRPAECRSYFESLVIDKRGGRRGFPVDVMRRILQLHAIHPSTTQEENDVWSQIPRL
jgi:tankyrase